MNISKWWQNFWWPLLKWEGKPLIHSVGGINQLQLNGKWRLYCCFGYWILKRHSECKIDWWCRGCFCYSKALNCHDFWPHAGGLELTIIAWFQFCPLTMQFLVLILVLYCWRYNRKISVWFCYFFAIFLQPVSSHILK